MIRRFPVDIGILSLPLAAHLLGGEVSGGQIVCPGPGHSPRDRSLVVRLDPDAPDGFLVHSFAGEDFAVCKDHVRRPLGLRNEELSSTQSATPTDRCRPTSSNGEAARGLWRQRKPVAGSIAATYLRSARVYGGPIQRTLGFLPATQTHPAALIAAYGLATEPEPGVLTITDEAVVGVHLIKLRPDGSDRLRGDPKCKITIGRGFVAPIVLAPPNDLLGLVIAEGVEDALTAHEATGRGAWAAGGASRMPALADVIPAYIEVVTILVDDNEAGRMNANKLAARLHAKGIEVLLATTKRAV
jgi:Toprim domain